MKAKRRKKLNLSVETVVRMDNALRHVAGGCTGRNCAMSLDCDTFEFCPPTEQLGGCPV